MSVAKSILPKTATRIVVWLVIFSLGVLLGRSWGRFQVIRLISSGQWRTHVAGYPLISPLLACKSQDEALAPTFKDLKSKVDSLITSEVSSRHISEAGVYFRDLNSSEWMGINQSSNFYPASLLKVPVMMAILKQAEADPQLLNRKLVYEQTSPDNDTQYNSSTTTHLQVGSAYTVDELVRAMIVDSDNNSKDLLGPLVDTTALSGLFESLDIPVPTTGLSEADYGISAKQYGLILRVLYNSTFLNQAMSQKALDTMSQSTFTDGLVAGVPTEKGIVVAHKFGIYNVPSVGEELHDCGIIYDPVRPYLLCVMTKGGKYKDMEATVSKISSVVYAYVRAE